MNADTDLFPSTEIAADSPRIKWLKKHHLITIKLPRSKHWCCVQGDRKERDDEDGNAVNFGLTKDEAEEGISNLLCIKHWSVEDFERATAPIIPNGEDW